MADHPTSRSRQACIPGSRESRLAQDGTVTRRARWHHSPRAGGRGWVLPTAVARRGGSTVVVLFQLDRGHVAELAVQAVDADPVTQPGVAARTRRPCGTDGPARL